MLAWITLRSFFLTQPALIAENVILRQQLGVLKRSVPRARIKPRDRVFWVLVSRLLPNWRSLLVIVQPETVLRWHRLGWRLFWRRKSGGGGRPRIAQEAQELIARLSKENRTWRAPRIQKELALLGHRVSLNSIRRYMDRVRPPGSGQRWSTFLRNHAHEIAACDLFTVPTVAFKVLHVFVAMSHDRRRILAFGVTANPTSAWTAKQITAALMRCRGVRFLVRDNDGLYTGAFLEALKALGLRNLATTPGSPWMNGHVERLIGTIRRECTDHLLVFSEDHLRRALAEYVDYYNYARPHGSLDGNSPKPRWVTSSRDGPVVGRPVLGGLHHVYRRAG